MDHFYEKIEGGNARRCPMNDYDGSVTGRVVINVPAWFDENPAEARRLGWVKHITHSRKEIEEMVGGYDHQSQYVVRYMRQVDEWTVEDVYAVLDKSEEMMLMEELAGATETGGLVFFGEGI